MPSNIVFTSDGALVNFFRQVVRFRDWKATSRSCRISRNHSGLQPGHHELHQTLRRPRAVHQRAQVSSQGFEPAALGFERPRLEAVSASTGLKYFFNAPLRSFIILPS